MPSKISNKASGARAIEKALAILFAFAPEQPEQSLTELSKKPGYPPSTIRRLLNVLRSRDLIVQSPETQLYRLGPALIYLAAIVQDAIDIRKVALPVMSKLRDSTGETVTLNELRDGQRVCIEKLESKEILRPTMLIGNQTPAHCGASGKVMLAYLEEGELKKYLQRPLEALTPKTITDPSQLLKELARIRKQGYAFSCGERIQDGLCAISAPIIDAQNKVSYSVSIILTAFRLRAKGRGRLIRLVKDAGQQISQQLGSISPRRFTKSGERSLASE